MWAEARRQEKKIRGIMVDYKKRAERRREYYEKIRQDPTQFLRLHGRPCKINLEQSVAEAAESPATMMPWQGDNTNMIDRFDVRAHLDMIPAMNPIKPKLTPEEEKDERRCNYERYRILVQNEYAGISEEQCLKQIEVDETFPIHSKSRENQKAETKKAAIGFTYEDSTPAETEEEKPKGWEEEESDDSDSSVSDIDLDVEIDIEALDDDQKKQVNVLGEKFGMGKTNMVRNLEREREEAEDFKRAKEEEAEKALYSGRKSRRERRALIEKRLRERRGEQMSPPSYAQRGSPDYTPYKERSSSSSSRSRSRSPVDSGKVTFITSFGGEEDKGGEKGATASQKESSKVSKKHSTSTLSSSKTRGRSSSTSSNSSSSSGSVTPERPKKPPRSPNTSRSSSSSSSRSRERNPKTKPKRKSKSKSRSRSRDRTYSSQSRSSRSRRSNSGSRSYSKYGSRNSKPSRSRSRDRGRRTRSRSPIRKERARSRSRSRERKQIPKSDNSNSKLKKKESLPIPAPAFKATNSVKSLTLQEKMKLRMQKALNKQHKADKIREIKKKEEKYQAEQDREDELRETMWKMRRREREKMEREREEHDRRRRDYSSSSQSSPENSPERPHSKQSSRQQPRRYSRSFSKSRSRSVSPPPRGHRR